MALEYGVKVKLGKMRVSYRESVQESFEYKYFNNKIIKLYFLKTDKLKAHLFLIRCDN